MELYNLQAFVTVAETGSFSVAAEQLHLTQPAISKRIAALESELDRRLFDRVGRSIRLTESGHLLLPKAKAMLDTLGDIRRSLDNLGGEVAGVLELGTSHHIGLHRLPPVMKHYVQHYPRVRLDLRFMDSEVACRAVEQGDLELAIVTLPNAPSPQLELTEVWRDPLRFAVGVNHPLATKKRVRLKDLLEYGGLLPGPGTYTREILETHVREQGLHLKADLSTNYLETLKMMVAVGLGWSLLPESLIDADLKVLPVPGVQLSRGLGIVRHRARTLSNAAAAMVEVCTRQGTKRPSRG